MAEGVVPDPGYFPGGDLDLSYYDYDFFDYWDDVEYGIDPYWDSTGLVPTGEKRKRGGAAKRTPGKRRKLSLEETGGDTAIFVSMDDRRKLWSRRAPVRKNLKSFALLPDWRKRCAQADERLPVKTMPKEMKQAAEADDEEEEETPDVERHDDAEAAAMEDGGGDEEGWEDEEEDEPDDPMLAMLANDVNVDRDAMKTVLREKLGAAGLNNMSEDAFMATIQKMLQGGGDADEATGELATALLGTIGQGGDEGASAWLSQQGVALDDGDEDDEEDAESVTTVEMPEGSSGPKGKGVQFSPADSGIDVAKTGRAVQMVMHDGSPKAGKKRLASIAVYAGEEELAEKKRKKVAFDLTESQENADSEEKGKDVADAVASAETTEAESAQPEQPPGEEVQPARAKTRAAKASAPTAKAASATRTKAGRAKPEPETAGPAKSTRKRKAEDEPPPPPAKKQTRKAAGVKKDGDEDEAGNEESSQPSYARATRATRARSGRK